MEYSFNCKQSLLLFFCYFKQLKLIKEIDRRKNSLTNKFLDIIAINHNIEKKLNEVQWAIFCLHAIYTFISIHIFIGHQSYPNWIVSKELQNKNNLSLYITSFYFLMASVSTVGYGDIVCSKSTIEICFQIIFLTVVVCIYSWVVSNIGNYITNQNRTAIKCNKDEGLLEEIRIAYPEMPFKLYHQILKHLKSRRLRQQKCEISILINSLPYSLRNNLLLTMYKQTTNRLKICKNCSNSDFIIKLLNSFIPLFAKKNGLLIHEGELIESIVFVNDGRLVLEASIDNYKYINIINILKNESYGNVYMFLDKPSPLSLRVKSKKAELLLLKKFGAFEISRVHSNIWKRFQRKAYLNMASNKNLDIKIIKDYSKINNIIPIQFKPKYIGSITLHDFEHSPNNSIDYVKPNKNLIKHFSSSSVNLKVKTKAITMDKEINKFPDKEQNNDLMANINKILNNKKDDNINENRNQCIKYNLNKEINKELIGKIKVKKTKIQVLQMN